MKDLSRKIELNCPICANNHFEHDTEAAVEIYKCTDCGHEFTEDEILNANEYKINANIKDVEKEVIKEVEKEFKKMFKF
ncbi:MAG: hypothetical protein KHZ77_04300 [Veillonella sp.]|uniref:ECs_2282 family putative zinc-binding protein n=1 Tax=Veillonella sp. TaxID=1926307 RepID=UPI0025E351DC|nr:hypothetical protein [Veillonella sp.]MBS4913370.1 hypothetical protein [Veillonella sp.]